MRIHKYGFRLKFKSPPLWVGSLLEGYLSRTANTGIILQRSEDFSGFIGHFILISKCNHAIFNSEAYGIFNTRCLLLPK